MTERCARLAAPDRAPLAWEADACIADDGVRQPSLDGTLRIVRGDNDALGAARRPRA